MQRIFQRFKRKIRYLRDGEISEDSIQMIIMDWVRLYPDLRPHIFHVANEGKRSVAYGAKLKDLGLLEGVSDLHISLPRHDYHGAWIEVKSKNGKLTEAQRLFLHNRRKENYFTSVVWSIDEGISTIAWYCNKRLDNEIHK